MRASAPSSSVGPQAQVKVPATARPHRQSEFGRQTVNRVFIGDQNPLKMVVAKRHRGGSKILLGRVFWQTFRTFYVLMIGPPNLKYSNAEHVELV